MHDREKVIKGLSCCAKWMDENDIDACDSCPYHRNFNYDDHGCIGEVNNDAIALLKEQEAMKPIYSEEKYGDHLPHCRNCEKVLPNNAVYGKVNFCHYCGQAVKWE